MEEANSFSEPTHHGWQKVTYAKKHRKTTPSDSSKLQGSAKNVGLEKHAEELEEQPAFYDDDDEILVSSNKDRDDDEDQENSAKASKDKPKKIKKLKITVAEAAANIAADDLAAFLSSISESYEGQQGIQLMRFADYFGRAFSAVSVSQFPWLRLFRESAVAKIADVPVSYISDSVYKTSVDWINHHSYDALGTFVLWSLDSIFADLATQLLGSKGSKKGGQPTSSKSQVAIFLVLAMVLRRKPEVLIHLLPKLRENSKYLGQDKLPVLVWMIIQASQGDLPVGLYIWAHFILPIIGGKSGSNPQSRDLVLQLAERILAAPKARSVLVNNAVRKGERLVSPAALDLLLHATFPASSARVKATERFEAIYPTLKEVALAGSPGSKAMKQVSQQMQSIVVKAAGEGIPALSEEATSIFIWCLTHNPDCYKQWDKVYEENIEASAATLRKLSEEWKILSFEQSCLQTLGETLRSFRLKNEKALSGGVDVSRQSNFREADKYCKAMLGRVSGGRGCMKSLAFTVVMLAVGALVSFDAWDWNKLSVMLKTQASL
ncbi:uncharacterized protein LOC130986521 [Salvia miltiorrhiza]|uniref:uncharacterized protein LOC130986521 n=1 Tax=Salvia miltiorrhiza TaxID=226208 RepID=UPI0025AB966A|nr:uncharacterized protein LOC130986521 [Salvia miltiorrhiza]